MTCSISMRGLPEKVSFLFSNRMLGLLIGFTKVLIVRAVRDRNELDFDDFSFSFVLLFRPVLALVEVAICESACHCCSIGFFLPLVNLNLGRL